MVPFCPTDDTNAGGLAISNQITIEVCVDNYEAAQAAVEAGADRIELCSALSEGGLTPSFGLMQIACQLKVPVFVMIRPRRGDFTYSSDDMAIMARDICMVKELGLAGVVFGSTHSHGRLDKVGMKVLKTAAGPLGTTLHRAIDVAPDALEAVEAAIEIGFDTILTSGQARKAIDGIECIASMHKKADGRINIMAGSGVGPGNARQLVTQAGLRHLHLSASIRKKSDMTHRGLFADADNVYTRASVDPELVQQTRDLAMAALGSH
ncbi:MAG: copper homeostasis protein CutC [Hyphomicrobiales bacterium]|nr:MAG: copper homeostasis protein CutC [Hyphomicrobiales bacterium]